MALMSRNHLDEVIVAWERVLDAKCETNWARKLAWGFAKKWIFTPANINELENELVTLGILSTDATPPPPESTVPKSSAEPPAVK